MARKIMTLDLNELLLLYRSGISEQLLASSYGVSRNVIRRRLLELGVKPRAGKEATRLRWEQMTLSQRQRQTAAANRASRGKPKTFEELCLRALTHQSKGLGISLTEQILRDMLLERGVTTIPQQAIGPYNCDLGTEPVAVECFGGNWHFTGRHARREPKRVNYLLDAGWHVLYVHINLRYPLLPAAADYIVAFYQETSSHPAMRREYCMIGGTGEVFFTGCHQSDNRPVIPPFTSRLNPTTGKYERVPR